MCTEPGPVSPATLEAWGHDLHRPECVVTAPSGDVYVPDWRGGVTVMRAGGSQETWLAHSSELDLRPNAIAPMPDGTFLIANLGDDGGLWRMDQAGRLQPFLTELDGAPLPPVNFVTAEHDGRIWASVSTRRRPRQRAWNTDISDGFVVLVDEAGPRIVADGLHYTNEVRPDPTGTWLYVVETFGRRITRFPILSDGVLGGAETVAVLGHGCFPDGFAFDESGHLWVTSVVSNRLLRIGRNGAVETVFEDVNAEYVAAVEQAFASGTMKSEHLGPIPGTRLQQLTSIGFGGPDRRTAVLGSLHAQCVYRFRAPDPGAPPVHWTFTLP